MNSNLLNSVKQDKRAKKDKMPLSEVDANILSEIMVALTNVKQDLLMIILNQYKQIPDSQVLNLLRQFNADFDPINYIEEDPLNKPKYIDINGHIFQISNIMSIERDQQFNYSTTEMQFRVIINKNAPDNLFLSNKIIFFNSLQQREYILARLRKTLEMYNIKIV